MKKPPDSPAKSGTKPHPPAFKNSELGSIPADWEVKRLGEIAPLQRGFDLPTSALAHGTIPVVYSNGILNFHETGLCNAPGLVTGRSGTIGKFTFIERGTYWPHNTTLWVTSFCGNEPKFVYYLYSRIGFERFSGGTGVPTLNRNDLHAYQIAIPTSVDEQRHIATALSDADAWIESLDKLIEKKKLVKQGTMQSLLSGKTRLPGFSGKWEEMQLGEIAIFPTDTVPTDTTRLPDYVGTENMLPDGMGVLQYEDTLPYRNIREYRIGDLLISNIRPYLKKIWLADRNGGCSTDVVVIRTRDKNVLTPEFLFFQLAGDSFFDFVMDNAIGTKMPRGDKRMMGLFSMPVPSLSEQCAITSALSDMDAELASLSREKAKAEQIKQGMMQELLTGRVRLAEGE